MKGYKRYKDSNEYWLGQIPIHWKTIRLKLISSISKGKKPIVDYDKYEDGLYPYLSMEYLRGKSDEPIYANPNEGNLLLVKEGDLIILWDGSNAGEIVRSKAGILSSTMAKIEINKNNDFNSSFLNYYLQIAQVHIQNNTIGMGIPHVNGNILKDLILSIPPLSEQTQIVSFLDKKTALIDEIIAKKERLIETLQAKRQATINEVVTGKKVWNPKTKTWTEASKVKNSGIDWLGEIPEDWEVTKLKYITSIISKGTTPSTEGKEMTDKGIRFIKAENIKDSKVSHFPEFFIDLETHNTLKRSQLDENDILMVIAGATIGKIAVMQKDFLPANTNQAVCFIRLKKGERVNFIYYWLTSSYIYEQIWLKAVQAAQPNLSMENVGNFAVPYPSKDIQIIIENYLQLNETKYIVLLTRIKTQIQKLKEYRQSLISEAVTGKIDVSENNEQ
jgi:type I restriction enzyme, S subunit